MRRESLAVNAALDKLLETEFEVVLTTQPPEQTCNNDFPLGINNSNSCVNATHHEPILDEGMCEKAAELSGAGIEHGMFHLSADYDDLHPQGCFAWHCGQSGLRKGDNFSMCYYFNAGGQEPADPHGPPICYRANYFNGTENTNRCQDEGYDNVMDENTCANAAQCLGFDTEPQFRVGEWNFSKHDEYPKGCFIRTDTGAFQFNNISSLSGDPQNPQIGGGIPVCNTTYQVHWPESIADFANTTGLTTTAAPMTVTDGPQDDAPAPAPAPATDNGAPPQVTDASATADR